MMLFDSSDLTPLAHALSWAVVHFLWQGVAIGLLAWVAFRAMRQQSANARYLAGCIAMAISTAAFFATFVLSLQAGPNAAIVGASGEGAIDIGALLRYLEPYMPSIAWLWLLGANTMLIRTVWQWLSAQRLKRSRASHIEGRWRATFEALCHELGVTHMARLMRSGIAEVPMVIGWLSPVVLVPVSAFTSLTPDQLRSILAHEIAHIRRYDYLVNCLQRIVESILFFHPVVWWLSNHVRIEREHCCDDVALRAAGDALTYAKALSRLDALRAEHQQLALAANGGSLLYRITRIVGVDMNAGRTRPGWMAAAVLTAGILLTAGFTYVTAFSSHGGKGALPAAKTKTEIYLEQVAAKLDAMVMEDELSVEDAEAKMIAMKKGIAAKVKGGGLDEKPRTDAYLTQVWAKLRAQVAAGELSAEDAEAKMIALKKKIAAKFKNAVQDEK